MTKPTIEVEIPFAGFYYSVHDSAMDTHLEVFCDDDEDEIESAFRSIDWHKANELYAKFYFDQFLQDFLPRLIDADSSPAIEYGHRWQPAEYNFATDRIFGVVNADVFERMFEQCDRAALDAEAKRLFTSGPGFMSFYSPRMADWPADRSAWDVNQNSAVLYGWLRTFGGSDWLQEFQAWEMDFFYLDCISDNLDEIFGSAGLNFERAN